RVSGPETVRYVVGFNSGLNALATFTDPEVPGQRCIPLPERWADDVVSPVVGCQRSGPRCDKYIGDRGQVLGSRSTVAAGRIHVWRDLNRRLAAGIAADESGVPSAGDREIAAGAPLVDTGYVPVGKGRAHQSVVESR